MKGDRKVNSMGETKIEQNEKKNKSQIVKGTNHFLLLISQKEIEDIPAKIGTAMFVLLKPSASG